MTKKKLKIKNILVFGLSFWILVFGFYISFAAEGVQYNLLQPLPGVGQQVSSFPQYIAGLIPFILSLAAVLAVVMIVIGGIQYAVSEAIDSKADARDRITQAIFGLLLALLSYLILYTINPQLVNLQLDIKNLPGASTGTQPPDFGDSLDCESFGDCDGPIDEPIKQKILSGVPSGQVVCFTYNPIINRSARTPAMDTLEQCQKICEEPAKKTGTQAECRISTNTSVIPPTTPPQTTKPPISQPTTVQCTYVRAGQTLPTPCNRPPSCTTDTKTCCETSIGNIPGATDVKCQ